MHDTHGSEEQDKQIRCLKPMKENVLHCSVFQKPTKLDGISRNNTAYVTLFTVTRFGFTFEILSEIKHSF